ncbi:MAG: hypothetical protein IIW40_02420 [Clostridia bacterium]|nr:hypothetical protein [Clostridia bacterium]
MRKPYTPPGVSSPTMKKPAACIRKPRVGPASCNTEIGKNTQVKQNTPVGQAHLLLLPMSAHSIPSPGLKSDILHGKTGSVEPQPPASTHIVQSAWPEKGANYPLFATVPDYHTTKRRKMQVFFSLFLQNFLIIFRHTRYRCFAIFLPQNIENQKI